MPHPPPPLPAPAEHYLKYRTQRRGHSPQIRKDEGCDPNKQQGDYRMNEPKCSHKRRGIVTSGEYVEGEPHAATNCCDRPDCIEDAKLWVNRMTLSRTAYFRADVVKAGV